MRACCLTYHHVPRTLPCLNSIQPTLTLVHPLVCNVGQKETMDYSRCCRPLHLTFKRAWYLVTASSLRSAVKALLQLLQWSLALASSVVLERTPRQWKRDSKIA